MSDSYMSNIVMLLGWTGIFPVQPRGVTCLKEEPSMDSNLDDNFARRCELTPTIILGGRVHERLTLVLSFVGL